MKFSNLSIKYHISKNPSEELLLYKNWFNYKNNPCQKYQTLFEMTQMCYLVKKQDKYVLLDKALILRIILIQLHFPVLSSIFNCFQESFQ